MTLVVLQKLKCNNPVVGKLVKMLKKGSPIIIEFEDGLNQYVTTPVVRIFQIVSITGQFYVETTNSRYRMEIKT